jgi:clostripain
MHIPQLARDVGKDASVDFLALELCNMGGIEIAYEWRPENGGFSADVLVAIPNAGPPLDWDRAFRRIRSEGHAPATAGPVHDPATLTAAQFGTLVVEEGFEGRKAMARQHPGMADRIQHEAAACYDLGAADRVKRAVDALAVQLAAQDDSKDIFEDLRGPGSRGTVVNYVRDNFGERPYADLYDLCARAAACEDLDEPERAAAVTVCEADDDLVIASFGMHGFEQFEPGRHGVFIVFPDGDAKPGGFGQQTVWSRLDWYTPLPAEGSDEPYGNWSFLADGATPDNGRVENWFELLDCWFDAPVDGDPGGCNYYVW